MKRNKTYEKKSNWLFWTAVIAMALAASYLFSSCSTVKKSISHIRTKTDSAASTRTDSSHMSRIDEKKSDVKLDDITVDIDFDTAEKLEDTIDSVSHAKVDPADYFPVISNVIKKFTGAGNFSKPITHVTVHIGSISRSSDSISIYDSTAKHSVDTVTLHRDVDSYNKNVFRAHAPLFITIGAICLLLLIIIYIVYRVKKSASASNIISKL